MIRLLFRLNELKDSKTAEWEQQSLVVRGNPVRVFKGNTIAPKTKKEKYQRCADKRNWKKDLKGW